MELKEKKLEGVCEINPRNAKTYDPNLEVGFLTMADVSEDAKILNIQKRKLSEVKNGFSSFVNGDVLVAKITPCFENGKGAFVEGMPKGIGFGSTEFHVLRANGEFLLDKYLYYIVSNKGFRKRYAKFMTGSAGQQRISTDFLKKIKIQLPPLQIQKQIVGRLDKIAEAQKLNDNLIQKADELFQSLLHNEYETKSNQWNSKKLQEVCEKIEQAYPKKLFKKEFSYIDIASISDDGVIRAQIISVNKAPSRARKLVKAGDTVFSTVRPYLKHIAHIPEMLNNSIASTGFCVIRPNTDLADPLFLNYVVESDHFVRKVLPFQRGANYPAVSDKNVYGIKISLPPLQTQKQIVTKLSAAQDYKTQLLAQRSKLKELFDSVLHKSMNEEF